MRQYLMKKHLVWVLRTNVEQSQLTMIVSQFRKQVLFNAWKVGTKVNYVHAYKLQVATNFRDSRTRLRLLGKCYHALRLSWYYA